MGRDQRFQCNQQPLQPADIAETIFWLMNQSAQININSLEVMPVAQA
ncbi:hypothetical protein [Pseudomonas sp. WJP1]